MTQIYRCEYRCLSCRTRIRTEHPAELFCVACKKIMHRWK